MTAASWSTERARRSLLRGARSTLFMMILAGCSAATTRHTPALAASRPAHAIIPAPPIAELSATERFVVDSVTVVYVDAGASSDVEWIGGYLSRLLAGASASGPRHVAPPDSVGAGTIHLKLSSRAGQLPAEGYELQVARDRVTLTAGDAAGLFHGVQTIRQLLPWAVEHPAAMPRSLWIPVGRVSDAPRFAWRGAMLDVARHFLPVGDVKRFIDLMALYKLNRLHLHLTDDQGWRLEIAARPNLALRGASTQVGGGPGGFYSQAVYSDIVRYAAQRYITIVPEIEMPGHTNAALASYPELNCNGVARELATGTEVGYSSLCVEREEVYQFLDVVVGELAAVTPGPYIHIGGDEVQTLTATQYRRFVERAEGIVRAHGKVPIGWADIATAKLNPATIVQHWARDSMQLHVARGGKVIQSPATKTYLDMKYDSATVLGLQWAARIEVRDAYDWDPPSSSGLTEASVLGVEAALWTETVEHLTDAEFLAFPRLAAIAEVGWSAAVVRQWESFRLRLAAHGPRLAALGVNFYRSPQIPWSVR